MSSDTPMRSMVVIAFLCAAPTLASDELGPAGERMATLFKEEFKFDSEAAERARELEREAAQPFEETAGDVVALPTFFVTERSRLLAESIEQNRVRIEADKFNWRDGGTIWKWEGRFLNPELKFKYNPKHDGIDLLSFSW